jgi:hypothetical protein
VRNAWSAQGTGISDLLRPDKSKSLDKKAVEEYADAVNRAIASITKHIEVQKADAQAIGAGVEEHARLRVEAQKTAAVQANGGKITAEQAEEFRKLATAAGQAALSLERAKVNSDISRDRQLAFASPQDVAIANQLRGIYGDDIPAALASSEAAAIRLNNVMKDIGDTVRDAAKGFTSDLLSGLKQGKSLMDSLGNAASNLSTKLMNSAVDDLFSGNFVSAGVKGIGAIISGIFGGNSEKKKAEEEARRKAAEEAERKRQAAEDRKANFLLQSQLTQIDTNTVAGQIAAFDLQANKARADEMKAGGEAILELEKLLAAQREDIVKKANTAVLKQYNDFLSSIKTGNLSTLSPEDQLKFAQQQFNSSVAGAQGGDEDAIARVTRDAQTLLEIAKSFYASSTGYASIYDTVTAAVQGLANSSQYTAAADTNIISQVPISTSVGAGIKSASVVSNVADQMQMQGYASGGFVMNGIRGIDSVIARLAGGEHVTKTSSVNSATRASLEYINRTGKNPGNDREVVRVLAQGFNGLSTSLGDKLEALTDRVKRVEDATRLGYNQRRVPGSDKKAA